jgi:beta-lactamase class A
MKGEVKEKKRIVISAKTAVFVVVLVWIASLAGTWYGASVYYNDDKNNQYPLLNPRLKSITLTKNTPEERSVKLFTSLMPLKNKVLELLGDDRDNVAFYVEDLNSGSWIGWKERDPFIPASLLKVPTAMAVMKKVDNGEWTLTQTFKVEEKYKDKYFGRLWEAQDGTDLTIDYLLQEMLQNSDNTAARIFLDKLTSAEKDDIYYHIGMLNPEAVSTAKPDELLNLEYSPKDLATVFRALYNATFITRKSSNYILNILTDTKFDETIPTEVPEDILVAHKIGTYYNVDPARPKEYHDCGIVYVPNHPYLYCIMTRRFEAKEAEQAISGFSDKAFLFFDENGKIK